MPPNAPEINSSKPPENLAGAKASSMRFAILFLRATFCVAILFPVFTRLHHPTLLGDDITRVVEVSRYPFWTHFWLPFGDHLAPLFQLLTSITWESIGHDVRLAPLAFSAASVTPWLLVLVLLWLWLRHETRSATATCVAVALISQSPLVLETVYWYSASSFLWSVAGVLLALWGASQLAQAPGRALALILFGSALGPTGTTIGYLAAPLAIIRAALHHDASKSLRRNAAIAAIAGVLIFVVVFKIPSNILNVAAIDPSRPPLKVSIYILTGLWYAVTVPGRILWPAMFGVPASLMASPLPAWLCSILAIIALALPALLLIRPWLDWAGRRTLLTGLAMIYGSYFLPYSSRIHMIENGSWTEAQFLYGLGGRYHMIPLMGVAAIIATVLASFAFSRSLDNRRGIPSLAGVLVALLMIAINARETAQWNWMLEQPDQKPTLAAVHHLGVLARDQGIDREQLTRIFNPVFRPWNGSLIHDRPSAFHLMNLAIEAPAHTDKAFPDNEARDRLMARLTERERSLLGSGSCASASPATLTESDQVLALATRTKAVNVKEIAPGKFERTAWPAYIEYEFIPKPGARVLLLPGLDSDHDVLISWADPAGQWLPGLNVRWMISHPMPGAAAIDLQRLLQFTGNPIARIRVELSQPGVLTLSDLPRLYR